MLDKKFADKLTQIAIKQLMTSTEFKAPRMERLKDYENAYFGKTKTIFRSQFNLPNLVFSGMVDALVSDLDEDISLKFEETDPADYNSIKKLNVAFKADVNSKRPNARWQLKTRLDKINAVFCGRGLEKTYAENNPNYQSVFKIVDYRSFHCEPKGGPILEDHLFVGEEDIFKTVDSLKDGAGEGIYSKEQLDLIQQKAARSDFKIEVMRQFQDKLNRFEALGLDADGNNFVGQDIMNLCEWGLTYEGERFYLLFDPWTQEWLRAEEWKDVFSSGLWHWTSWATHEDLKLFWSKSFADDFYPVGEAVKNLLDQELTNRQKRNLGAKGYDKKMYRDVSKLDAAQSRPDALVPVWVPENKSIKDGLIQFETPELQGTINLINWIESDLGKHSGVTELTQQAASKGAKANVQYTLLQQAQKRIGFHSKSFREAYEEVGLRWVWGLIDHLDEDMAIRMMGKDGFGWDKLTRADLKTKKPFEVRVTSQTEEDKLNVLGKDQKFKAIELILSNELLIQQNNPKVLNEMILRDVGGLSDEMVSTIMDTQNYGQKDVLAEADKAIEMLSKGKEPEIYFDATTGFIARIHRWERINQNKLKPEITKKFQDYIDQHMQIVAENMQYMAGQMNMQKTLQNAQNGQPADQGQPQQNQPPQPSQQPVGKVPQVQRPAMAFGGQ